MFLVHGGVRNMPTKWRIKGVRCRSTLIFRRIGILFERQARASTFRPTQDCIAKIPDNRISARILRCRELRRCEREDDVSIETTNKCVE